MGQQADFNPFDDPRFQQKPEVKQGQNATQKFSPDFNPFDDPRFEKPEGRIKSTLRTLAQVPLGLAQAGTFFMDLILLASHGDVFDDNEIDRIEAIAKREGVPFDREEYLQNAGLAFKTFPTVSNIARMVEESTGAPLTPKTNVQQSINFASTIGGFLPKTVGSFAQRQLVGAGVSGVEQLLESKGLPREVAEPISSLAIGKIPPGTTPAKLTIGKKTKPSGLVERRFEKTIKQPTPVSSKKIQKIDTKIEKDFRKLQDKIVDASPVGETKAQIRDNPTFKAESREVFKEVEKLAENIPGKFDSNTVRQDLSKRANKVSNTAFGPSEYDKAYKTAIKEIMKDSPIKSVKPSEAVAKFRSNNRELGEIYQSEKSGAWNRGKKDALLDHNRSIADAMESQYPDSEFIKLFRESNEQWTKIKDLEAIDKFTESLFKGEIKFERGQKWLDRQGMREPFKRALGEKGFKQYEQLLNDLMTTQKARSLMKKADSKGLRRYFKHHLLWKISPKIGVASIAIEGANQAYSKIWESLLDKPRLSLKYSQGINAAKAGDFRAADKIFKALELEILGKEEANALSKAEDKALESSSVKPAP